MNLTAVRRTDLPAWLEPTLARADMYDSSSSPEAQVTFIDSGDGFFLKRALAGMLERENAMTTFFHRLGLTCEVLRYERGAAGSCDWLLKRRLHGEDCTTSRYLEQPERLVDIMAEQLVRLHALPTAGCPEPNHTAKYLARAENGWHARQANPSFFTDMFGKATLDDIHRFIAEHSGLLQTDTLLHGDYCLPNIILDDWRFSGFIDLDSAGVGDRHVDLFWALWTLRFNLHTDAWDNRFLDVYGRAGINPDTLRLVAAIEVFG